jgi:hypothetical protein
VESAYPSPQTPKALLPVESVDVSDPVPVPFVAFSAVRNGEKRNFSSLGWDWKSLETFKVGDSVLCKFMNGSWYYDDDTNPDEYTWQPISKGRAELKDICLSVVFSDVVLNDTVGECIYVKF